MEHFNSPPGWPRPPWNWRPEPGWRPDPSWPAPPQGWNFWVDDYGYPTPGPHGPYGAGTPDFSNSATQAVPVSEPSATAHRGGATPAAGGSTSNAKTGVGCVIIGVLLLALMGGCISLFKGDDGSNDPGSTSSSSSSSSSTSSSSSEKSSPSDSSSSDSSSSDASSSSTSSSSSTATDNGDDNRTSTPAPSSTSTSAPSSTTTDSVPEPSETRTSTPLPDPTTTSQQPQYLVSPSTQEPNQGAGRVPLYANCDDVRAAGAAPIHPGDPGFLPKFDSDGDGDGCE